MKRFFKIFKLPEFYIAVLLLACIAFILLMRVTVENVVFHNKNLVEETSLPILKQLPENSYFRVELDILNPYAENYDLKVIPDDCAENMVINGESLDLSKINGRCDYSKGFILPDSILAPYKVGEKTHYSFTLKNHGGNAGLNLFLIQKSARIKIANCFAIFFFVLLSAMIARRLKFGTGLLFIVFIGVLLRTIFFANIPYTTYSQDVDGHVAYVQYILENKAIPSVDDCWTCYHPPVYYTTAAPSFFISENLDLPGTTGLQVFSLLLSTATLLFGILFFKTFLTGAPLGIASLLFALWPLMILVSPRIGNDQMFYLLHTFCLFSGATYLKEGRGKFLILAVLAAALAIWTKTSAIVTLGTLFLFVVFGYLNNARKFKPTKSEIVSWGLFLLIFIGLGVQKLLGDGGLVGNASGLHSGLIVGNEAFNYLYFDLQSFITHPYTSAWNNEWGRNFFWNYAFKTSLFGEFEILNTELGRSLATFVSVSFLGLLIYAIRGFWKIKFQAIHWILFLHTVAFFAALAYLRIKYPYACSNDFRYIAPVLLSSIPFVSYGICLEGSSLKWKILGTSIFLVFVTSSVLLYMQAI